MKESTPKDIKATKTEKPAKAISSTKIKKPEKITNAPQPGKLLKPSTPEKRVKTEIPIPAENQAVVVQTTKSDKPKKKRISKGLATYNRRVKQDSRKEMLPVSSKK